MKLVHLNFKFTKHITEYSRIGIRFLFVSKLQKKTFFFLVLDFPVSSASDGLKWVRVHVPEYRFPGENALLQCDYELGNDALYSVKWYKEHEEFYSFLPKQKPPAHSYRVEGVNVDVSKSTFFFTHGI